MRFVPLVVILVALALVSGSPAAQAITHGANDGVIHPSVGALLAIGATREEAVERAGRAADCVRFVVSNAPSQPAEAVV